jgi:hypothetical protein
VMGELRRSHVHAATHSELAHVVTRGPLGAEHRASACTEGYTALRDQESGLRDPPTSSARDQGCGARVRTQAR